MLHQINKLYNKLAVKITFWICLSILPVIILVLTISNLMIDNLQEKLLESYKNELAISMTRFDSQIQLINEDIARLLADNWVELNLGSKSSTQEIEKYTFWQELSRYRENLDLVEYCFIKTNWDNDVAITYDVQNHTYNESELMRQYLVAKDFTNRGNEDFEYFTIEDKGYLIRSINCNEYSFGFILNIENLLSIIMKPHDDNGIFYIANQNGEIKSANDTIKIDFNKDIQDVVINGNTMEMQIITYASVRSKYMFIHVIPAADLYSEIPVLERLLQVVAFLSILVIPIIYLVIKRLVLSPLFRLDKAMREIELENMDYRIESVERTNEFIHIVRVFNRMVDQITKLTIESYEKDIEKLEIEAVNMRLQVNPHMLLNSLNMIYSLSHSKNYACIQEFTLSLAEYFRYSLYQNDNMVKISEEMKFINNYLEIQKIRFPGSFTYTYDIEEEILDELIPSLIIQNFVENSIKYGLTLDKEIEILVIVKRGDKNLRIFICDTGNGMDEKTLDEIEKNEPFENKTGNHIGIWNCRRRLRIVNGEANLYKKGA